MSEGEIIATAIDRDAIPFLKSWSTLEGIKKQLEEGNRSKAAVWKKVNDLFFDP